MPTVRPLGEYVIVKREQAEEMTPGGIALPSRSQKAGNRGRVVATGPGHLMNDGSRSALEVLEGDIVEFRGGSLTQIGDEEHVVLRESDIIFIVTGA